MRRHTSIAAVALTIGLGAGASMLSSRRQAPSRFFVGNRLGPSNHSRTEQHLYADLLEREGIRRDFSAESCSYDPGRGRDRCAEPQRRSERANHNAWVSFINHDGSVHTARWIGVPESRRRFARASHRRWC